MDHNIHLNNLTPYLYEESEIRNSDFEIRKKPAIAYNRFNRLRRPGFDKGDIRRGFDAKDMPSATKYDRPAIAYNRLNPLRRREGLAGARLENRPSRGKRRTLPNRRPGVDSAIQRFLQSRRGKEIIGPLKKRYQSERGRAERQERVRIPPPPLSGGGVRSQPAYRDYAKPAQREQIRQERKRKDQPAYRQQERQPAYRDYAERNYRQERQPAAERAKRIERVKRASDFQGGSY